MNPKRSASAIAGKPKTYSGRMLMTTPLRAVIAAITYAAMFLQQVEAYLPLIDFDGPGYVPGALNASSSSGWALLSGNASVTPTGGIQGSQSLSIPPNEEQEPFLRRDIPWSVSHRIAFIDLQLKPAGDPSGSQASFHVNGTQLAFQVPNGGSQGEIWVYNGRESEGKRGLWSKTISTFPLAPGGLSAAGYIRVTIRQDYTPFASG